MKHNDRAVDAISLVAALVVAVVGLIAVSLEQGCVHDYSRMAVEQLQVDQDTRAVVQE